MVLQLNFSESLFLSTVLVLVLTALVLWYFADYYDDGNNNLRPY